MTPSFIWEARRERIALALHLLDPIGALIVGALTFPTAKATLHAMFTGSGPIPSLGTTLLMWAAVLMASGTTTVVQMLLRAFGESALARKILTSPVLLVCGVVYAGLSEAARLIDVPYPRLIVYFIAAFGVFATVLGLLRGGYIFVALLFALAQMLAGELRTARRTRAQQRALSRELVLCGGLARGVFRERNMTVGAPEAGEMLLYGELSAQRGTVAIGSPGSSKTRAKMYPDLYWALRSSPQAGALVFVTKRRATDDCLAIAQQFRSPDRIHVVGVGKRHIDLTAAMTHESIGDAIQDGLGVSHSDFWRHGPSAFFEGFIELVRLLAGDTVAVPPRKDDEGTILTSGYKVEITHLLPTLLRVTSLDEHGVRAVLDHAKARAAALEKRDADAAAHLREVVAELRSRVLPLLERDARLAEELRQSVLPQLQPFARGPIQETFCDPAGLDLSVLEDGHVVLVEVDEAVYPRAVGTVVRMIFRRIVQMARERTATVRLQSLRPIVLICDEYTNYAAPGHVRAWNTIRESKFCATVGITSISALIKQLGGDEYAANAIVANFGNKFFFDVDDRQTRELACELIGQSLVVRRATSEANSHSHGGSWSGQGGHQSQSRSRSETTSEHREDLLDGDLWRYLGAGEDYARAVAFVRTPQGVQTDVVVLGVLDPQAHLDSAVPEVYGLRFPAAHRPAA